MSSAVKRLVACVLVLVGVTLAAAAPASAQLQASSTVLEEIQALKVMFLDINLMINDINHELYEVMLQVNEARSLIARGGSLRLIRLAIEDAIEFLDLIIVVKFEELSGMVDGPGGFHESIGNVLALILQLLEDSADPELTDFTPRDKAIIFKLKLKTEAMEKLALALANEVDALQDRLDNGEADACDGPTAAPDVASCLDEALAIVLEGDPDALLDAKAFLDLAYQVLRTALRESNRMVRKKKLILSRLALLETLCFRVDECRDFVIEGGAATLKVIPARTASVNAPIIVYNLAGRLVRTVHRAGALQSLQRQLPNGVYLAVNGHRVERLVVLR
jgi:hypothetical protein